MDREKIRNFYSHEMEANRLEMDIFKLEGIRTKEIIGRYLHKTNLEILDVGGGAGYYSFWLQEMGHNASLIDLSPKNIELVRKHSEVTGKKLKKFEIGDAVHLDCAGDQFDIVLLLGPLYHLTERGERVRALAEVKRLLKPQGVLIAAVISRYASLFDGFHRDLVLDDRFFNLLMNDLQTGIHLNKTGNPEYFTTAFFHTPKEIISEIFDSGLKFEKLIPVESFGWIVHDLTEKEKEPGYMKKLLETIKMLEGNEDLLVISPHIIAVARKE
jgi:SAM-dependent methyltransferase